MSVAVPVLTVLVIVARRIIGAGADKEPAAEKERDEFPFPEAAGVAPAWYSADKKFRSHQSRIAAALPTKNAFMHIIYPREQWPFLFGTLAFQK